MPDDIKAQYICLALLHLCWLAGTKETWVNRPVCPATSITCLTLLQCGIATCMANIGGKTCVTNIGGK